MEKKSLVFANAGQVKPFLLSRNGPRWVNGEGVNFPLGMIENAQYRNMEIHLEAGEVLVLLTDGITEAMNPVRELYSSERLEALAGRLDLRTLTSVQIIDEVFEGVKAHMDGSAQHDDMTIVVVKVL